MKRLFVVLAALLIVPVAADAAVKVIVHPSNGVASLTKEKAGEIFLKKLTRWENGKSIVPVDQSDKTEVREDFSHSVLSKEVAWVKSYWQKMIFSGRATPPAELAGDAEVISFVKANPDAIGYVSEAAAAAPGVKAVEVKE